MKLRPFELGLVLVFVLLFFMALIMLKTYEPAPDPNEQALGSGVVIWGTLAPDVIDQVLDELGKEDSAYRVVSYRYVSPESFDQTFLNALADQNPPDLLLLPHEKLVEHRSRLQAIPYDSFPIRDFRNI